MEIGTGYEAIFGEFCSSSQQWASSIQTHTPYTGAENRLEASHVHLLHVWRSELNGLTNPNLTTYHCACDRDTVVDVTCTLVILFSSCPTSTGVSLLRELQLKSLRGATRS